MKIGKINLAKMIDHTLLKPEAIGADIIKLCREAKDYGFAAVCVNPCYVELAADQLAGSGVLVDTVVGFPLGAASTGTKVYEAAEAVRRGAAEIDMVINMGALKERSEDAVLYEISAVVNAASSINPEARVKVIIETCYLGREEKILACRLAMRGGAHFVKTSTGFGSGGATVEDVALMRSIVGDALGVKASGGIKSAPQTLELIRVGASRIGASAGVNILKETVD